MACVLLAAACNKDNTPEQTPDSIEFADSRVTVEGLRNNDVKVRFSATSNWVASVDSDWMTAFPMAGKAGDAEITLIAKSSNVTGEDRECTLTVKSGDAEESITVVQGATDVLLLEKSEIIVSPEGEQVHLKFSSNVSGRMVLYTYTDNVRDWILPVKDANTKAMDSYEYILEVVANPDHDSRSAEFYIEIVNPDNPDETYIASEIITIFQEGIPVDTSTDYSSDGTWKQIHTHTAGAGVPIVLMGDGFADVDIASGYYEKIMQKAMDNLFSEEPMNSLRDYFDVWYVTAVSRNNAFGDGYSTCFGCKFDEEGSSRITGSENTVLTYIYKVPALASMEQLCKTLAIVLLNSSVYAGTTGFGFDGFDEFGLAFCPVVDGPESERFRSVLVHEAIGHGFAKLYDEYAYETYGNISISTMDQVLRLQNNYGWAANVSVYNPDVPWKRMLSDERYALPDAYGEVLGIYEGACTYWTGAWRPTDDSMMRTNRHGFNAPSREAIYKRTMKSAFGKDWEYVYEDFVTFDQTHLPQPSVTSLGVAENNNDFRPLPAPYFAGRSMEGFTF